MRYLAVYGKDWHVFDTKTYKSLDIIFATREQCVQAVKEMNNGKETDDRV